MTNKHAPIPGPNLAQWQQKFHEIKLSLQTNPVDMLLEEKWDGALKSYLESISTDKMDEIQFILDRLYVQGEEEMQNADPFIKRAQAFESFEKAIHAKVLAEMSKKGLKEIIVGNWKFIRSQQLTIGLLNAESKHRK